MEADIKIPEAVSQTLKDFPPCPHHCTLAEKDISDYSRELLQSENLKFSASRKLCLTMVDKQKYVCHSSLLDYFSKLGVEVSNIKKALRFRQAPFLRDWVDLNTRGRQLATLSGDHVKRAFHKLLGRI